MKPNTNRKMGLKKLTIAKINIDAMHAVNGGSSSPPDSGSGLGYCFASSPGPGRACIQMF